MITVTTPYEDQFEILSATTFTLSTDSTGQLIPLKIIDDLIVEETEVFTVTLGRLDFGDVSKAKTIIRITDDDEMQTGAGKNTGCFRTKSMVYSSRSTLF